MKDKIRSFNVQLIEVPKGRIEEHGGEAILKRIVKNVFELNKKES